MDFTEAIIRSLDTEKLYDIMRWAGEETERRSKDRFPGLIRGELRGNAAVSADRATRVVFPVDRWDDGWWYDEQNAEVHLANGTSSDVDFHDTAVHGVLSELSWAARRQDGLDKYSCLVVDLTTGEVKHSKWA